MVPPFVRFATRIWHPNIDPEDGYVGLDVLYEDWHPEITILTVLTALLALLIKPELFYPRDASDPAKMYFKDFFEFRCKALLWTRIYAQHFNF